MAWSRDSSIGKASLPSRRTLPLAVLSVTHNRRLNMVTTPSQPGTVEFTGCPLSMASAKIYLQEEPTG